MLDPTHWIVWPIVFPLFSAALTFLLRDYAARLGLAASFSMLGLVSGLTWQVVIDGPQRYSIGGWQAPLGIELYADGLSVVMLVMVAVVGVLVGLYAVAYFAGCKGMSASEAFDQARQRSLFWPLWLFLWAALNALFLSADLFNLYVSLELLGLAAVALVALSNVSEGLTAAMRYLLVSLLGSLSYLLGVALLYAAFAALDLKALAEIMTSSPVTWAAIASITVGLLLKTAVFPLHFWLPPAHANAPTPVSALLSALVVKASFYILLRLWFDVFSDSVTPTVVNLLGILGAAAIFWGSLQALRQSRLKLLIAYSTVAQLGYLFLVFPLALPDSGFTAWSGVVYFALSHSFAKAALFLTAGTILHTAGHDRISELGGVIQRLPISAFTFLLAGISLTGLPPSGGFIGKWMLLNSAIVLHQWWWAIVIVVGGLLTAGYLFRVIATSFENSMEFQVIRPARRQLEWLAFSLSIIAVTVGFIAPYLLALLRIGAPVAAPVLMYF